MRELQKAGANSDAARVPNSLRLLLGWGLEDVVIIGLFRLCHGADLLGQGTAGSDELGFLPLLQPGLQVRKSFLHIFQPLVVHQGGT